jgi:hypothetical protein
VTGFGGNDHTPATDAYLARFLADSGLSDDRYDVVRFGSDQVVLERFTVVWPPEVADPA